MKKNSTDGKKKFDGSKILSNFSEGLIKNKWIVIAVFIVLIIASVVGNMFVKKESDVISYLDSDTVTKQGLATLQDEFNIIGDFSMGLSYINDEQLEELVTKFQASKNFEYVNKIVYKGSFTELSRFPDRVFTNQAEAIETLNNKFDVKTTLDDGTVVDTFIVSVYFKTPNSDDNTIATIDDFEDIINEYYSKQINDGTLQKPIKSVDECYCFSGSAQNSRSLLKSSIGDMPKFVIAAVIAVFVILFLTTRSYLEPLIFLATLGISILLNMGTNIIAGKPIGKISSITASCATILQLAVAMDYAIFLMHTYYEELRTTPIPKEAMIKALPKTIKSVVASSLTTVGGFVALFFMKFGIGYDLGFVLAKGVILSLITVICLQPIIILLTNGLIQKTQHKWSITPRLKPVSKVITKKGVAIPIIVVCLCMMIPACILQSKVDLTFITVQKEIENPNLSEQVVAKSSNMVLVLAPFQYEANRDTTYGYADQYKFIDEVYKIGYKQADKYDSNEKYYVFKNGKMVTALPNESLKNDPDAFTEYQNSEDKVLNPTLYVRDTSVNCVSEIFSLCTIVDQQSMKNIVGSPIVNKQAYPLLYANFISLDGKSNNGAAFEDTENVHYILYTMTIDGPKESDASYSTVTSIINTSKNVFGEENPIQMTGNVVAAKELSEVTPTDYKLVSIISVAIIFLILLLTFRKPLLSIILVIVIETGIWSNLTITYLMGTQLHFMAYLIVTAIALGATVDYAILLTSKYLEEKQNGATGQAAVRNAIYRAAPGVLTSGSIFFVACLAVQLISTNIIVQQITALLARNAIFSAVLVFTYLPAILSIMERVKRTISIKRGKGDPDEGKVNDSIYSVSSKNVEAFAAAQAGNASVEDVVVDAPAVEENAQVSEKNDEPIQDSSNDSQQ